MTDIPKRLSDVELAKLLREKREAVYQSIDIRGEGEHDGPNDIESDFMEFCLENAYKIADAIERLSTPPSQGKVERAREIAHNIVSYCREHRSNTDVPTYTREEAEEYVTSAITQALTESSRQGTDGACCEAMREAAANAAAQRLKLSAVEWKENDAVRAETYRWAATHAEKAIRALPITPQEVSEEQYLVWSHEHGAWWRPERSGYTVHASAAGRYSKEEALSICGFARNGWSAKGAPSEIPVRESDIAALSLKEDDNG